VTPIRKLNDDNVFKTKAAPLQVQLQGVCNYPETDKFGVKIIVTIPYYDPAAEAPGTENDIISDSDDYESKFY
jgi:hypothetical protein